jgi:hypothetical protein
VAPGIRNDVAISVDSTAAFKTSGSDRDKHLQINPVVMMRFWQIAVVIMVTRLRRH